MLKRQRPATPPPSSLGDPPSFLPDGPARLSNPVDPSQPRSKRQRIQPPPLDGALRGWLESEPTGPHCESDGEEDWIEDARDVAAKSSLPPSMAADAYRDTNSLLHELHVLNQHRLLNVHSPRDQRPIRHAHIQDPPAEGGPAAWPNRPACHSAASQLAQDRLASRNRYIWPMEEKGLVEEVQCVRQRYGVANRYYPFF